MNDFTARVLIGLGAWTLGVLPTIIIMVIHNRNTTGINGKQHSEDKE
jgi:hypothetical protein